MQKRGKKIDVLRIEEGAQRHSVELRFDKRTGEFLAELGDVNFSDRTLGGLRDQLQDKARKMVDYEFKWYLRVSYDIVQQYRFGHSSTVDSFDDLDAADVVGGFNFSFEVVERSQLIETNARDYRGRRQWMCMCRDVEEVDGELRASASSHRGDTFTEGDNDEYIEFTPERYAKLKAIRVALRELARRLHEAVGGDAKKVQRVLDKMPAQPLLLAARK